MKKKLAAFQERFKQDKRFQKKTIAGLSVLLLLVLCAVSVPVALHLRGEPDMPRAVAEQKAETDETTTAAAPEQSTAASDAAASSAEAPGSTAAAPENSNSDFADAGNAKTGSGSGASSNTSGSSASAGGSSSNGGASAGGSSSAAGSSGGSTGSGGNTAAPAAPAPEPEFAMTADEIIAYASNYIESTYNATYIDEFNKNNCGWNSPWIFDRIELTNCGQNTREYYEECIRGMADATCVLGASNNYYKVYVEMRDADTMVVYFFY